MLLQNPQVLATPVMPGENSWNKLVTVMIIWAHSFDVLGGIPLTILALTGYDPSEGKIQEKLAGAHRSRCPDSVHSRCSVQNH